MKKLIAAFFAVFSTISFADLDQASVIVNISATIAGREQLIVTDSADSTDGIDYIDIVHGLVDKVTKENSIKSSEEHYVRRINGGNVLFDNTFSGIELSFLNGNEFQMKRNGDTASLLNGSLSHIVENPNADNDWLYGKNAVAFTITSELTTEDSHFQDAAAGDYSASKVLNIVVK